MHSSKQLVEIMESTEQIEALEASLRDADDWTGRQRAANQLKELGSQATLAIPALMKAVLEDPDYDVARDSVAAIARILQENPSEAVAKLSEALGSHHWQAREEAARQIGSLGHDATPVLDLLWQKVLDGDADVARAVGNAIVQIEPDWLSVKRRVNAAITERGDELAAAIRVIALSAVAEAERDELWHALTGAIDRADLEIVSTADDLAAVLMGMYSPETYLTRLGEVKNLTVRALILASPALAQDVIRFDEGAVKVSLLEIVRSDDPVAVGAAARVLASHTITFAEDDPLRREFIEALLKNLEVMGAFQALASLEGAETASRWVVSADLPVSLKADLLSTSPQDALDSLWESDRSDLLTVLLAQMDYAPWAAETAISFLFPRVSAIPPDRMEEVDEVIRRVVARNPEHSLAKSLLGRLGEQARSKGKRPLLEAIRSPLNEEDDRFTRILELLGDPPPPQHIVRELVNMWSSWIAMGESPTLIEGTAYELRTHPAAVLPLVEQLRSPIDADRVVAVPLGGTMEVRLLREYLRERVVSSQPDLHTEYRRGVWLASLRGESTGMRQLIDDAQVDRVDEED